MVRTLNVCTCVCVVCVHGGMCVCFDLQNCSDSLIEGAPAYNIPLFVCTFGTCVHNKDSMHQPPGAICT